jgi:hypothetical protein
MFSAARIERPHALLAFTARLGIFFLHLDAGVNS